ncbi:hypothetical protein PUN28_016095 [Cardiocondyla obscurior]|uniref:Uncharacterized protein n=1 Tax=Cardiocondyla obscurior TaxID=286306 RepID=A0AAW2EQU8_9HYME
MIRSKKILHYAVGNPSSSATSSNCHPFMLITRKDKFPAISRHAGNCFRDFDARARCVANKTRNEYNPLFRHGPCKFNVSLVKFVVPLGQRVSFERNHFTPTGKCHRYCGQRIDVSPDPFLMPNPLATFELSSVQRPDVRSFSLTVRKSIVSPLA